LIEEIRGTRVSSHDLAVFWLWQNSFILKTPKGTLIAIDPYFSHSVNKYEDPNTEYVYSDLPMRPEEVLVDYVFCTHDHLDHADPETLPVIAKNSPKTKFLGTPECYAHFLKLGIPEDRATSLDVNITVKLADFKVTPIYSIPEETIKQWEKKSGHRMTTHYGYIFDFNYAKVYNMGDSSPEVAKEPMKVLKDIVPFSPEIAMLPVIGDFPDRKPEDARVFAKLMRAKIVIPSHYGCFKKRTIDPQLFVNLFRDDVDVRPIIIEHKGKYIYNAIACS